MNVKIVYRDGSRREFKPTYLSYDGSTAAIYEIDNLDLSNLEEGVYLVREHIDKWGVQRCPTLEDDRNVETKRHILIVPTEEYPNVLQIRDDNEVVLENDGNGWLVQPKDY